VRSCPEVRLNNVIATVPNNSYHPVLAEQNGWLQINMDGNGNATVGWIVANRAEYGCNLFSEEIKTFPYTMQGRIIGPGGHNYVLDLKKGQTLILRGDWPDFSGPAVSGHSRNFPNRQHSWWRKPGDTTTPEPAQWRWTVTQSGSYTMSYDSNFKGFEYGPCVVELVGEGKE